MRDLCYLTDEVLVKMFKDGNDNEKCFNEIYNRYYSKLSAYAVSLIKSRADAEEIVNVALFKAFKYLHKFRGDSSLSTWLLQILRNQAFGMYRINRSRGVYVTQSLDVITIDDSSFMTEITDYQALPENFLINQEITECIISAIDDLPETMKETAILYFIDEEPLGVIAKKQSCSIGAIRSRIFRIKKLLKSNLEKLN